jgi:hypothetical protein
MCILLVILNAPSLSAETTSNTNGPELETYIIHSLNNWLVVRIHVENIGDATAHNVTITSVSIEGNVIFNFQKTTQWADDLEPGEIAILDPNSLIIGFGIFTISMTVSCEEGASSTSTVTGLIVGPFIFIP